MRGQHFFTLQSIYITCVFPSIKATPKVFLNLLHYQYWIPVATPLGYPVVALCHEDPAALDLQNQPFQVLRHVIDVVGVDWANSKHGSGPER